MNATNPSSYFTLSVRPSMFDAFAMVNGMRMNAPEFVSYIGPSRSVPISGSNPLERS